jgi:hypothetical protein
MRDFYTLCCNIGRSWGPCTEKRGEILSSFFFNEMHNCKLVFKIIVFFLALMFLTSSAQAIIILKCKSSTFVIDEKLKKAGPKSPKHTRMYNYRNISPEKIVFEFATRSAEKASIIWRVILDLEKLKLRATDVQVSDKDINKIFKLAENAAAGKVDYDKVDELKKELFEKYYIKPENFDDFEGEVLQSAMSEDPENHVLEPDNMGKKGKFYQVSFSRKCTILN